MLPQGSPCPTHLPIGNLLRCSRPQGGGLSLSGKAEGHLVAADTQLYHICPARRHSCPILIGLLKIQVLLPRLRTQVV